MRHYDTSCGPMSCVPTRKDGVPEFVIKPYKKIIVVQWCSDIISEMTTLVISLMVSLYTTARQYRGFMTNFGGYATFLVGTQGIGPHEVS